MTELTLFDPNGAPYWTQIFEDSFSCDIWLAEEQTKPYWNPLNSWNIQYIGPTPEQIAEHEAEVAAYNADRNSGAEKIKNTAELTESERQALFNLS